MGTVVSRLEEGIRQCDLHNTLHRWVITELRINIKENRHIHRLPRIQPLFLKTKTLDLRKVLRDLARGDGVGSYADDVFGGLVCGGVEGEGGFPREDAHFALLGLEGPGKDVRDGTVECYAYAGCALDWAEGFGRVVRGAVDGGFDGLAAPAGGLADHFVHGDGAVGEGDGAEDGGDGVIPKMKSAGVHLCQLPSTTHPLE